MVTSDPFFVEDDADVIRIIELASMEAVELGKDVSKINFEKLMDTLFSCKNHGALIATRDESGQLSGFMAIAGIPSFWSDDVNLASLMYYVHPAHRNGSGLKILRMARDFAAKSNKDLTIYLDTLVDMDRKEAMFEKLGFRKRGGSYTIGDR